MGRQKVETVAFLSENGARKAIEILTYPRHLTATETQERGPYPAEGGYSGNLFSSRPKYQLVIVQRQNVFLGPSLEINITALRTKLYKDRTPTDLPPKSPDILKV